MARCPTYRTNWRRRTRKRKPITRYSTKGSSSIRTINLRAFLLNSKILIFDLFQSEYNPGEYEHLAVSKEIKQIFSYITYYTPQIIDIELKLKPFIPDYIPAVGDIDGFIKVADSTDYALAIDQLKSFSLLPDSSTGWHLGSARPYHSG